MRLELLDQVVGAAVHKEGDVVVREGGIEGGDARREVQAVEPDAVVEGVVPDGGDRLGDHDVAEVCAAVEHGAVHDRDGGGPQVGLQAVAVLEGAIADAADPGRQIDPPQGGAAVKGPRADAGHAGGEIYLRQSGAVPEGAVRQGIQFRLEGDGGQGRAGFEDMAAHGGDGGRDGERRDARAGEDIGTQGGDPGGQRDLREARAAPEGIGSDGGHRGGDVQGGQSPAVGKRTVADLRQAGGEGDARDLTAVLKAVISHNGHTRRHGEGPAQGAAAREGVVSQAGEACGDVDGGKAVTALEAVRTDGRHPVGQFSRRQPAPGEGVAAHRPQGVREGQRGDPGAVVEGIGPDLHQAGGDVDLRQGPAVVEGLGGDHREAVREMDLLQGGAAGEGPARQAGHRVREDDPGHGAREGDADLGVAAGELDVGPSAVADGDQPQARLVPRLIEEVHLGDHVPLGRVPETQAQAAQGQGGGGACPGQEGVVGLEDHGAAVAEAVRQGDQDPVDLPPGEGPRRAVQPGEALPDLDGLDGRAVVEHAGPHGVQGAREHHMGEGSAALEAISPDALQPLREDHLRQRQTAVKAVVPQADGGGHGHGGQLFVVLEALGSHGGDGAGEGDAGQVGELGKGGLPQGGAALLHHDGLDIVPVLRPVPDRGVAVVLHGPRAADGQHAGGLVQVPLQVRAAAAAGGLGGGGLADEEHQQGGQQGEDEKSVLHGDLTSWMVSDCFGFGPSIGYRVSQGVFTVECIWSGLGICSKGWMRKRSTSGFVGDWSRNGLVYPTGPSAPEIPSCAF